MSKRGMPMQFNDRSDKPFGAALDDLLHIREWSNRQLAKQTQARFGWGSHGTINFLINGDLAPSRQAMEMIATACGVHPDYFAEYRLLQARDQLDPHLIELDEALANLAACPVLQDQAA